MLEQKHGRVNGFIIKPHRRLQAMEVAQLEVEVGWHAQGYKIWVQIVQNLVHVRLFVIREALQAQFIPAMGSAD